MTRKTAVKKSSKKATDSAPAKKIITHDLLKSWSPCTDGYKRYCQLFPDGEELHAACEGLAKDGHDEWALWLFRKARESGKFDPETQLGYANSGHRNSGHRNSGDQNSGHRNSGHWNSGDQNSGDRNSGDQNSGDQNSGHRNSGHWNSGDQNSGHRNSGHWNSGDQNSGHFNTFTPAEIMVFNKPCKSDVWEKAYKPPFLWFGSTEWVYDRNMSDQEKIDNPKFFVAGGYLKKLDYKTEFQKSWGRASEADREKVRQLPNFDAEIFFAISGIDLREKQP